MLIFNCTKAAADFFSTTEKGKKISPIEPAPHKTIIESMAEPSDSAQWQWLVHAIKVKRKNVLITMDYQSRFSINLTEVKKGEDESFLNMLEDHLTVHVHEMMESVDIDVQEIKKSLEYYFHQHTSRAFYQRGDRSAQAHVNDVAWHFRHGVEISGDIPKEVELIGFDVYVNSRLRKRKNEKDYFYPQREFLRTWLQQYGEHSTAQADACIENLRAKERAEFAARHPNLAPQNPMPPTQHREPSPSSETQPKPSNTLSENIISLDAYRKK